MSKAQTLSFVIPCYRSELTIKNVINEIDQLMKNRHDYIYEIVLINDASPDDVWRVIEEISAGRDDIKAISFSRNFGQHAALMAGYRVSDGDIIITLDDDGQIPVFQTFDLVNKLDEGYDVVYAKYKKTKQAFWRRCGSRINDIMAEVLIGKPKHLVANSFFVMKSFIKDEMIKYQNSYPYIGGLVFRSTKSIANVVVEHRERKNGKSGYSFLKLIGLWMNGFTAFSVVPLRASSIIGTVCALIGFVFGIITIIRKLIIPSISVGWSSIIAIILFIGGLIMLMLGVIGEYIGRVYISINSSPQYVIRETININEVRRETE